ncbi:hypothetical protein RHMOL_Rhmol09G0108000 [Rhododendron molle]|uniref:Uncharacterized protein n=1 Tax=Rhododendron molle TaxID=49168 RepID=A0ACC0MC22_RHOML|nr:hypothetical protein RHMOL_Rhmol09G0108000 [Rhododendron molle]
MSRQPATSAFHKSKTLDNKYMLGDEIGKGAYGRVYKGLDLENGDFVAIKQVSLENIAQEDLNVIMNLNHKNIVKYLGSLKTKTHLHIILEYVENGSLANIIKPNKFGPFPESLVAVYIAQVLEGLVYLHEQGVIHRDIKGANILTTKEGLVKLADFGVATKLTEADLNTHSVVGTPYWMAPEPDFVLHDDVRTYMSWKLDVFVVCMVSFAFVMTETVFSDSLKKFYFSQVLNDRGLTRPNLLLLPTGYCSFSGVTCDTNSQAISLNVSVTPLHRVILPDIGCLDKLVNFTLTADNLTGFLPAELLNLTRSGSSTCPTTGIVNLQFGVIEMSGVCAASDIWSVGCTVIELLTCVPPYYDLQPMPALFRIVQDEHPPIPDGLSPDITDFLRQCFKKVR